MYRDEVYSYAAAAEQMSEHPLGKSIVRCYGKKAVSGQDFHMEPGEGVSVIVEDKHIFAGNEKLVNKAGISIPEIPEVTKYINTGSTVIYISIEKELAGFIVLSDTLRDEAPDMIGKIEKLGITPVLLTGDHEYAASFIAGKLGIRNVKSDCLPEDKLTAIGSMQKGGDQICMIGDEINDAPALKKANVGIAMGGVGSDIALVDDEIMELPHLLALSKRMMTTIKINLTFSMALNFLTITLAITGLLGPVIGALVHNAGSVVVIINSALLLRWKKKKW